MPIRIHDLETKDVKLFEGVTGCAMRTLDFVFKTTSGVNRPLKSKEDHPNDNLNKTYYQDQINKVSLAIKEIITSLGQHIPQKEDVPKEVFKPIVVPKKNNRIKIIIATVVVLAMIVIGYFLIPTFSKPKVQLEKSIAVLPFRNDSPNDSTTYFLNGVMEEILTNLQKISDFSRVLSRNSVEQFRNNTTKSTPEIAKKLNVNYIVEGSGQKYGNKFVLRVQLIVANNEKHLLGKSYEKEIIEVKDIFSIQSQIAEEIAAELEAVITPQEKQLIEKTPTDNLEAYRLYMLGISLMTQWNEDAYRKAIDYYHQAIALDSSFAEAYAGLASAYYELSSWDVALPSAEYIPQARAWALKV